MRKWARILVIVGLALCMGAAAAQAQTGLIGKGIKAGVNFTKWHGSDSDFPGIPELSIPALSPESRTGVAGGLYLRYGVGTAVYIQPEVLYSMKGTKYSTSVAGQDVTVTMKFDYIEVPVMLKYAFQGSGSSITPNIGVGPAFAFKASAKSKVEAAGASAEGDVSDVKSFDFGVAFGGGLDFGLGQNALSLDLRYTLGLSSIDNTSASANIKNGGFTVSVGYGF